MGFSNEVQAVYDSIKARDPNQTEFLQAVEEVLDTMGPVFEKYPQYIPIVERLAEPERVVQFRVSWLDDKGKQQVNRGFRVQFSSALGPYKGGLRFHPTVNLSIIKFLGFEQILKNSLTTLPMGGGKGGSDFNPKGRSDNEVMKFCQAFMTELNRHIGQFTDVPAGDINVGSREVGFLFGQYKRLKNEFVGVLTGKGLTFGGSLIRPEATGYGLVYFVDEMLRDKEDSFKGKRVVISGAGNVATYAAEKILELGGIVLTFSDSTGYVYEPEGFTKEGIEAVMHLKTVARGPLSDYKGGKGAKYEKGKRPWAVDTKYDIGLPCATQNEVEKGDAEALVKAGAKIVAEGANMPSDAEAIKVYHAKGVEFGPAKAANAGGVAVSGLEMCQNSQRLAWSREEVDDKLKGIMASIYKESQGAAKEFNTHLQGGANIAGFLKVAEAMQQQGVV